MSTTTPSFACFGYYVMYALQKANISMIYERSERGRSMKVLFLPFIEAVYNYLYEVRFPHARMAAWNLQ